MRRSRDENSTLAPSKKLKSDVSDEENDGINDSKEILLAETGENPQPSEDVKNPSLKQTTNLSRETETELNSKGSECEPNVLQEQKQELEVEKPIPLDSNEPGCVKEEVEDKAETKIEVDEELANNTNEKCEEGAGKRVRLADRVSNRKKLTNLKLSKLIFPKCAWMVLNDLKKGCVYKTVEKSGNPRSVLVTVTHRHGLMEEGEGSSKAEAKNIAAEKAIKKIVLEMILEKDSLTQGDKKGQEEGESEKILMNIPWKELTSLAMYKLFEDWERQGVRFPEMFLSKLKVPPTSSDEMLPFIKDDRNPCAVLTDIFPGLAAVEVERQDFPQFNVTMGYLVEGKLYSASGGTKKEAKKKAAMIVLKGLYGLETLE